LISAKVVVFSSTYLSHTKVFSARSPKIEVDYFDSVVNYYLTVRRQRAKSSNIVLHEKTKLEREEEKERKERNKTCSSRGRIYTTLLVVGYAGTFCQYQWI